LTFPEASAAINTNFREALLTLFGGGAGVVWSDDAGAGRVAAGEREVPRGSGFGGVIIVHHGDTETLRKQKPRMECTEVAEGTEE
jgi:hypothetical protein